MSICGNIEQVRETIEKACGKAGRPVGDVCLVAVSKTQPVDALMEAYEAGCRDFGENRVQELVFKAGELPSDIRWHMIGHLQRNKVKQVVGLAHLIHSVDSLRLAREISRESILQNRITPILLQVNVSEEETKFGMDTGQVMELVRSIALLPGIRVEGLMTVPPFVENGEENRVFFEKLHQLSVDIARENIDNVSMNILSMGMSGDYEVAIGAGATHVRVGTGIFGHRTYNTSSNG